MHKLNILLDELLIFDQFPTVFKSYDIGLKLKLALQEVLCSLLLGRTNKSVRSISLFSIKIETTERI